MRRATAVVITATTLTAGGLGALVGFPTGGSAASPEASIAVPAGSTAAPAEDTPPTPGGGRAVGAVTPTPTASASTERTHSPTPKPPASRKPTASATPTPTATRTIEATPTAVAISMKSYRYGSDERQQMDVFAPAKIAAASGSVRRATIVMVHGGSWVKGNKSSMHGAARDFVGEGYIAIPVNYRLAGQAAWPAQREDVQQAIRWVREHADMLHVDVSRIVVLGSSAGAEIAASALTEGNGSRYARGLVALSGPMDLALVASNAGSATGMGTLAAIVTDQLLRCLPSDCADKLRSSSAISHLDSRDPASLIIASREEWVDPRGSYRFHAAALENGVASDLKKLSGTQHGMNFWDRAWPTIRTWVAKRMAAKK